MYKCINVYVYTLATHRLPNSAIIPVPADMGLLPRMLALKLTKPVVQWFSLEFRPATWCFLDRHGEMWGNSLPATSPLDDLWVQSFNMAVRLNIFMFMGMFLPGICPTMTYKCVIGCNCYEFVGPSRGPCRYRELHSSLPGCFSPAAR